MFGRGSKSPNAGGSEVRSFSPAIDCCHGDARFKRLQSITDAELFKSLAVRSRVEPSMLLILMLSPFTSPFGFFYVRGGLELA